MERTRPVSDNSLLNLPRASRQYWEGYKQALLDVANAVDDNELAEILRRQANETVKEKLP